MVLFQLIALVPMIQLGDRVRQLPVRQVAQQIVEQRRPGEPLAMIGVLKPSLHFYTDQGASGARPGIGPIGPQARWFFLAFRFRSRVARMSREARAGTSHAHARVAPSRYCGVLTTIAR